MEFVKMNKTPRLFRDICITEKIDGSNALIGISEDEFKVGTRNGWLDGSRDHHNLYQWAMENRDSLIADLGPGLHRGEWCGKKVNRAYGLDHNKFALFNVKKWADADFQTENLTVVPTLYTGVFSEHAIQVCIDQLNNFGSRFAYGFDRPEGIVVYHTQADMYFKVMCENDQIPKGLL